MSEATVIMSFLVLRVLLLGGLLIILPRITRSGLLFGTYVGEAWASGEGGRQLRRRWDRGCLISMALALAVAFILAAFGRPLAGNLTGTAALLLAAGILYLRTYASARDSTPPEANRQAARATAPLDVGAPKGERWAKLALALCLLAGLATAAYALVRFQAMPDRVPSLSGLFGGAEGEMDRSVVAVLFFPSLSLVYATFIALLALLTSRAKLSLREGSGGRSIEVQRAFRGANAILSSGVAILFCALLSIVSIQIVRYQLLETGPLGWWFWGLCIFVVVYMATGLVVLMKRYGQGGARAEGETEGRPLAGGLADNAHWVLGVFYVDREDPSMMVEKRFGIGYTANYGNRHAILIMGTFAILLLGLTAIGVIEWVS